MFADLAPGLLTNLLLTAAISFGVQLALWLISLKTRDATLADWWWGLGYATIALFTYVNTQGVGVESRKLLITACTVIWGVRLSAHLVIRSHADRWRELDRYEKYRLDAAREGRNVNWYIYRKVFGIQGLMMWITSLPVQVTQFYLRPAELGTVALIGAAVWLAGFLIEAFCDWQLARFKADPANQGRVLNTGLWYFTRHPNYFGEALLWWGIFLIACDHWIGLFTIVSPIRMHHRMAYRQGIGWLEQKMSGLRPEYRDYIARTNRFYPWLPRKPKP
jgi:steroid 5-alpha reductase family enzyme